MKPADTIINNQTEFLRYLKSKFTLIHLSNFFFRDLHYGVISYLENHGIRVNYKDAESVAREVSADLEQRGVFRKVDHQSWKLNYPEFALPRVEKIVPPAPVAPAEKKTA